MSIRKPIIKVTKDCPNCQGGNFDLQLRGCLRCNATGRIDVKQNDPKFKKYYQKVLEEWIENLTTEYRYAERIAGELRGELNRHCKELDKVVNG